MIAFLLLSTVITATDDYGFPLVDGYRWTYEYCSVYGGKSTTTVEVDRFTSGDGKHAAALAIIGEWLFHGDHDVFVDANNGTFEFVGTPYESFDRPLTFVRHPLTLGDSWISETDARPTSGFDRARHLGFGATVVAEETVTVPAGTFSTWKIEVQNHAGAPASPRDFLAWFTPGVGFVKYQYRYNPYLPNGTLETPITYELREHGKPASGYPIAYPALSFDQRLEAEDLLAMLPLTDPELLEDLETAFLNLGPGVIPALLDELRHTYDLGTRDNLRTFIQAFTSIEIAAIATRDRIRMGDPLPIEFHVRNNGCASIPFIPYVEQSDRRRFPSFTIEVQDENGTTLYIPPPQLFCGNVAPLNEHYVKILEPGESLRPIHSPGQHYMLKWTPNSPGKYLVRCIYEASGPTPPLAERWLTTTCQSKIDLEYAISQLSRCRWNDVMWTPTLRSIVEHIPHGRIVSNDVSITVTD